MTTLRREWRLVSVIFGTRMIYCSLRNTSCEYWTLQLGLCVRSRNVCFGFHNFHSDELPHFSWIAEAAYFNRLLNSVGLIPNAGLQGSHSGLGVQAFAFRTCNTLHHRFSTCSYLFTYIMTSPFPGRRSLHQALKYSEGVHYASMVLYIRKLAGLGDVRIEGDICSLNRSWQELCSPVNSSFSNNGLSETTPAACVRTALGGVITVRTSFLGRETTHTPSYFVLFPRKTNYTLQRGSFFVCLLESWF